MSIPHFPFPIRRPVLGLVFLVILVALLVVGRPWLNRLLPAADLAYLLRDGRYLILLQNNAELRATGGFIGSFAEVEMQNGRPGAVTFGTNIYKLDEPFTAQVTIPSPPPLTRLTGGKWAFRDSNWAADGPEALRQSVWFFERESGRAVDGVIAVTTNVVEELIRLVGPIEMPAYATTLSADNFAEVVQYKVEKEYFENRTNWPVDEPKTILKELIPILEQRLGAVDKTILVNLFFTLLDEKYIVLFAKDPLAQKIILDKNWGGAVAQGRGNFLALVNSNVDGGKSSRKIEERIRYTLDPSKHQVTLYLEREHTGSGIWPDSVNRNWLRILVPRGSKLLSARMALKDETGNFEISEEAGKTVFANWMNTNPGEVQDAMVVYELPQGVELSRLTIRRQPGANPDEVTVIVGGVGRWTGAVRRDTTIDL